jgi:hypothetical protein
LWNIQKMICASQNYFPLTVLGAPDRRGRLARRQVRTLALSLEPYTSYLQTCMLNPEPLKLFTGKCKLETRLRLSSNSRLSKLRRSPLRATLPENQSTVQQISQSTNHPINLLIQAGQVWAFECPAVVTFLALAVQGL